MLTFSLSAHRPAGQIKFFDDIHSYSEMVLYPWGHTNQENITDIEDVHNFGERVRTYTDRFVLGQSYAISLPKC